MTKEDQEMSRTTVAFSGKTKEKLEKAVIEIIIQTKKKITLSEVVHTCIESYLNETVSDIKERRE